MVIVEILEIPNPVQVHIVLAVAETFRERIGPVREPDGLGPLGFGIHGSDGHILPVRQGLGGSSRGEDES